MNNHDIFADAEASIQEMIDPEQIVNINLDEIDEESREEAAKLIEDISRFYYDEKFMKEHPQFKKQVDSNLESLRINLKMRAADEVTHDILIKSISQNPGNASLYKALTDMQRTIISITTKIEDIMTRLSTMMKGYQTELNFEEEKPEDDDQPDIKKSYRGSKAFIEQMANVDDDDVIIPEEEDE